jgi:DNA-binding IclR family transcriptional regulator
MEQGSVQSIKRVLNIIEVLSRYPRGMALTELSGLVSLHKSTVHRILSTLISSGYVARDSENNKYRLTFKLFEIGSRVAGGTSILSFARPYLDTLAEKTGEAIHMVIRDGNEIVYIYKEDPSLSIIRMASYVGLRSSMYCTGVGKAILAAMPLPEAKDIWDSTDVVTYTKKTITSFSRMEQEMALIQERGYSVDDEEHEDGVRCVAAAVKNHAGFPVAAISVSAPVSRLSDDRITELAPLVIDTAKKISQMMGYTPHL